ncbi:ATP-dependent DNA/RNA helicase DHX36 [Pundamilia nyererei]|uniref:RNA helicase n=1 Tax=Pundamilia nyererei TaxID=303518 RepID=A0A9Y6M5X2_9CICH|nr:PREDICTED: ATP-dependent RNA helicase DHX36 [Pundamilia nyererei]
MSYGYGGGGGRRGRRGGRGHRDDSRERWERGGGGGSRGNMSEFDPDRGGGGQRDRPPPHLKGREIGLWYARYGAVRRKQADRRSRAVVQMDEAREQHITKLLNSVQNDQLGPERGRRDEKASTSDSWQTAAMDSAHCYFDGDLPEEEKTKTEVKWEEEEGSPGQKKATGKTQSHSTTAVKDEPPDQWDEEDQEEEVAKPVFKDKDLEFLHQEVVRERSLDDYLKRDLQSKKSDGKYKEMLKFREKLPSYGKKEELVTLINSNRVLVVSGETGCGKTTQVTQFILDDYINRGMGSMCRVVCTQPRRISAISVAERVAAERAESVGNGNSCGYQIRLQSRLPRRQGSILYCTTGIILQWLRSDPYSDTTIEALEILDRDEKIDLDLILALIRYIVLNEEVSLTFYQHPKKANTGTGRHAHSTEIPPADQEAIQDRFVIIPLHSLMPTVNQTQVFKRPPPGVRKIVIATNIAETSITIDDVVYVIDGGKIKETNFDTSNNISTMMAEWVSLANAKQRKGRAGRVCPGKCYHLYNGLRASLLDAYQLPEIMRTPLEELCLQIKILKLGSIGRFLEKALDRPTEKAVSLAIKNLTELNALDQRENLTALGFHLARLPVEPHIGKLILFGALLGCLDPVLTIAASLSFKDPFFIPLGKEKMADMRRKALSRNSKSDHLTIVNAFQGWEDAKQRGGRYEREYCWDNFLSANTLQMLQNMKGQFAEHLMHAGFVSSNDPKDPKSNVNSGNEKLIKAVIVAGLYPKVAMIRPSHSKKRPGVKVYTQADGKVCIHPKSVNAEETEFNYTWLIYHLKMRTSSIFLYDCTEVSPFSLLFFGGDITIQKDEDQETIAVDQWIVFRSPARIAHLVKSLKKELDSLLQDKICNPAPVDWQNRQSKDCAVITAIIDLITTQEKPTGSSRGYGRTWASAPRGEHVYFNDEDDDDD